MTNLIAKFENVQTRVEFDNLCHEFLNELRSTDSSLFSLNKKWSGYGTWKSEPFFNNYHFLDFTELLENACKGVVTHEEEKEFTFDDFEENIISELYDKYF